MSISTSRILLSKVGFRSRIAHLGHATYLSLLILAGAYALLVVLVRLLSLLPAPWATWQTLLIVPAGALLLAAVLSRRPTLRQAARLVDERIGTKDLYLTASMIDHAPGAYRPLVLRDAESKAPSIRAQTVVPYDLWPKAGRAMLAMGVLTAAVMWMPSFDPFGLHEERKELAKQQKELDKQQRATALRADELRKKDLAAKRSAAIDKAVSDLQLAFNKMEPRDKAGNLKRLMAQQRSLEQQWMKKTDERKRQLQSALNKRSTAQRLGSVDALKKTQQWRQDLQAGKTDSLKKELDELKQMAQQLAKTSDPAKKQQLQQQMQKRLKDLANFANQNANSLPLQTALAQAMQQCSMFTNSQMSDQASEAMMQSLDLSQLELDSVAQSLRDLQDLQQAMQALQQAKMLNQLQPLDGQQCQSCQSMADYAALYAQCLSQCQGQGQGMGSLVDGLPLSQSMGGMRGPGQGRGGLAPEDPSIPAKFQTKKARTHLTNGKILLQWKTKELADKGQMVKDYRQSLQQIKQDVSEAIISEEVPPGYRDAIRKYFGNIEKTVQTSGSDE